MIDDLSCDFKIEAAHGSILNRTKSTKWVLYVEELSDFRRTRSLAVLHNWKHSCLTPNSLVNDAEADNRGN